MIFDTDVLIWLLRGSARAAAFVNAASERATSIISMMELIQGCRSKREMSIIRRFLHGAGIRMLPLDASIGHVSVTLMEARAMGDGLQVADALIAATALEAGLPLGTANVRHFRAIAGIDLRQFRP